MRRLFVSTLTFSLLPTLACTSSSDGEPGNTGLLESSTGSQESESSGEPEGSTGEPDPSGGSEGTAETGTGDEPDPMIPEFSPGCGMPFTDDWLEPYTVFWGEETIVSTVEAAGVERQFLLELPESYDPEQPYPIVFTFHGYGAEMDNAFGQNVADYWPDGVIAVYPQGLGSTSSWNTNPNGEDFAFFVAMLNEIGGRMCLDMSRVFVQGTSMGGIMSNALACARADIVDGLGVAASSFPLSSDQCSEPVPAWIMHGENDGTIGFGSGEVVRDTWRSINGCSQDSTAVEGTPCVEFTDCQGAPVVWCPHQGGHDLPSVQGLDDDLHRFLQSL